MGNTTCTGLDCQVSVTECRDGRNDARAASGSRTAYVSTVAGPSSYLESCGNVVTQGLGNRNIELVPCRCKSWFCPNCALGKGLGLRDRLLPILESFKGMVMLTLTVDPKLFFSPQMAHDYVRSNRCIARLMKKLHDRGHLVTNRWFCVVEWQKESQMAHYHVLCDSTFIPFWLVCDLWNTFRPAGQLPPEGERPGFGSIRFSARRFKSALHAGRYACKYLIKSPEQGYPDWVMDSVQRLPRYTTARGFWGENAKPDEAWQGEAVQEDEREQASAVSRDEDVPVSIRDRVSECGQTTVVLQVNDRVDESTGEVVQERVFVGRLGATFADVVALLGADADGGPLRVPWSSLAALAQRVCFLKT